MKKINKIIAICIIGIVMFQGISVTSYAAELSGEKKVTPSGISYPDIGEEIESYIEEREEGLASCEVAVFSGDETLYEGYFGYADIDNNVKADENTVYEWASCSKLLTWISVMQLVEDRKIDLKEDIRTYLPKGFLRKLKYEDEIITMENLMSHNAGWQESIYENQQATEMELDDLETTLRDKEPYQAYHVGEHTAYSNYGTALAAFIVQEVSSMDYADYVHENIFKPLGMEHTTVSADRKDNMWVREQREKLHTYIIMQDYYEHYGTGTAWVQFYPAGAATGTLEDFMTFAKSFVSDECPLFDKAETRDLMYTVTSYYGDSDISKNCHGLWTAEYAVQTMGHAGNSNCSSMIQFDPKSGLGIVIMTNEAGETAFNYGIPRLLFGKYVDSEGIKNYSKYSDSDIKGIYVPTRGFKNGFAKIFSYTGGILPIKETDNPKEYEVNMFGMGAQMTFTPVADNQWIQSDGNGMDIFIYETEDEDGNTVFEMMSTDYIIENNYLMKAGSIVAFYLLGISCILTLVIKLIAFIFRKIRKHKKTITKKVDRAVLAEQITFAGTSIAIFMLNFSCNTVYKPVMVVFCIIVSILALLSFTNTVYLIYKAIRMKELKITKRIKYVIWSLCSLFYFCFIVYFQLYNFWNC